MLKQNYIVIMEIPDIFPYLSTDFANILLSPLSAQILLHPTAGALSSIVTEGWQSF